ncbi:hypothetical protein ZWY2020_054530 [Hordeum vulgare]|nr:hypothetical protein ZWY2020_054530 [Hordeum vulgare]
MPEADIVVLPAGSPVTLDFRTNRLKESRMSCADPKAPAGEQKKTSWPEVVGKSIEEAKEIILKDMPEADIVVLPAGSPLKESRMSCADPKAPAGEEKKSSWPELVGKSIEDAREVILKDMPEADIEVLPTDSVVSADWRSNRVRILVDTVATTPHIG